MKISYRILIAALAAVVIIFASSTLSFYSLTGRIVLGLAGVGLSLVFLLLFLDKKNARAKAEYSGFIALINQNLSLSEVSDSVLAKIIKSTGLAAGRLYMVDKGVPKLLASYGMLNETSIAGNKIDLYQRVIEKGEEAEFSFTENFPVIRSGLVELAIRYLLIYPLVYNQNVVAILEIASVNPPRRGVKEYLASIKDQLAAGLSKAYAMHQLENLVQELKVQKETAKKQNVDVPVQQKALPEASAECEDNELLYTGPEIAEVETSEEEIKETETKTIQTILVTDPNSENRKIISRYLSSKHYNITEAETIQQAMNEISQNMPFAVTLSVTGSGAASWGMLKDLKEKADTANLPIILYNTVDPLNFGYGLQVYDYVFNGLNAEVIKTYSAKLPNVKNIVCAGFSENALNLQNFIGIKVTFAIDQTAAFKAISKLQPGLVFVDATMENGDGISLIDRLKTSFETREVPVVLCFKPGIDKEELAIITAGIEKVTIKSKGNRVDILKAIRDRIRLEEGFTGEDTSSILIETMPEEEEKKADLGEEKISNKILIVDDDDDTLTEVGDIVSRSGCEAAYAKSGHECLAKLQKLKPDLILLDIMMPQMDGFETIRRIKAERNLKDIPVFALTAHEMIDEKEILIRNGFDDFISKPVDSGSLSFKIEKVLNI